MQASINKTFIHSDQVEKSPTRQSKLWKSCVTQLSYDPHSDISLLKKLLVEHGPSLTDRSIAIEKWRKAVFNK